MKGGGEEGWGGKHWTWRYSLPLPLTAPACYCLTLTAPACYCLPLPATAR